METGRPPVRTNLRPLIRAGPGGRTGLVIQAGSLLLTGITLWLGRFGPRVPNLPFGAVVAGALLFALLACLWSGIITAGLYLLSPRRFDIDLVPSALRTASVAVWFAPATILFSRWSPIAAAAAVVLVVTATRLLYSEWHSGQAPDGADFGGTVPLGILGPPAVPLPLLTREFVTGMVAATCLQVAATSAMFRHRAAAGALFALAAAILTFFAMTTGAVDAQRPRSLPQSLIGILLTIFLAAGVTITGLRPRLFGGGGGEGDGAPSGNATADPMERPADPERTWNPGLPPDGSFPGVILAPEVKPVTRLVAPAPPGRASGFGARQKYAIPFSGEYWLFRFPFRRPPPKSYRQRGTPVAFSYSTVDKWPLLMEAHQALDPLVDLDCCRAVRVEIRNADRYPDTLALELFAMEREVAHSLGTAPVVSVPREDGDATIPALETLEYRIVPGIHECSELKVVFRRARDRADKSARVSIERFVLGN